MGGNENLVKARKFELLAVQRNTFSALITCSTSRCIRMIRAIRGSLFSYHRAPQGAAVIFLPQIFLPLLSSVRFRVVRVFRD